MAQRAGEMVNILLSSEGLIEILAAECDKRQTCAKHRCTAETWSSAAPVTCCSKGFYKYSYG